MSGFLASRDQNKVCTDLSPIMNDCWPSLQTLWFVQEGRRLKGQAETLMMEAEKEAMVVSYVLRPASVLPQETTLRKIIQGLAISSKYSALNCLLWIPQIGWAIDIGSVMEMWGCCPWLSKYWLVFRSPSHRTRCSGSGSCCTWQWKASQDDMGEQWFGKPGQVQASAEVDMNRCFIVFRMLDITILSQEVRQCRASDKTESVIRV
jgi:hypothetical protein